MATFTTLLNAIFGVGEPITASTGLALRDNPISIAEAAAAAPAMRNTWLPYDYTDSAYGTGLLYDYAVTGTVTEVVCPDFAADFDYRIVVEGILYSSTSPTLIELYAQTSGAYDTIATTGTKANSAHAVSGLIEIFAPQETKAVQMFCGGVGSYNDANAVLSTFGGHGGANRTTAQPRKNARVTFGGSSLAGKVYMFRRANYRDRF